MRRPAGFGEAPADNVGFISVHPELLSDEFVGPPSRARRRPFGPNWYVRVLAAAAAFGVYQIYRRFRVGAGRSVFERGLPVEPFRHAMTILRVEHALWLDFEEGLQEIVLPFDWIIRFSNGYYSWAHQVMTFGLVLAVLLRAHWTDAKRWVGALLLQLPIALLLFRFYPLMPPRLLDSGAPWGGRILQTHRGLRPTGIVDTLAQYRGPWTPVPPALHDFTNQYAAMPSLHCAFSLWVGIVWWRFAKGTRWRIVGPLHSAFMFFCVVVTGNHFVLDAVAGWALTISLLAIAQRFIRDHSETALQPRGNFVDDRNGRESFAETSSLTSAVGGARSQYRWFDRAKT